MKRVYPYGNLASQVLGVVNVDNDGLTGLEKQYNKLLTGTNGSLVRDARGTAAISRAVPIKRWLRSTALIS